MKDGRVHVGGDGRLRMEGVTPNYEWIYHSSADGKRQAEAGEESPNICERGCWWEIQWRTYTGNTEMIFETGAQGCVHHPVPFPEWATVTLGGVTYYTPGSRIRVDSQCVRPGNYHQATLEVDVDVAAEVNRVLGHGDIAAQMPEEVEELWQQLTACGEWALETLLIRRLEQRLQQPAKSSEWRQRSRWRDEHRRSIGELEISNDDLANLVERIAPPAPVMTKARVIAEWWEELISGRRIRPQQGEDGSVEELLGW